MIRMRIRRVSDTPNRRGGIDAVESKSIDLVNDTYAKTSQEASRKNGEADWMKLTDEAQPSDATISARELERSAVCDDEEVMKIEFSLFPCSAGYLLDVVRQDAQEREWGR